MNIAIAKPAVPVFIIIFQVDKFDYVINVAVIGASRPTYPSSKPKRVDWDKLEAEVKKEVCLLTYLFV